MKTTLVSAAVLLLLASVALAQEAPKHAAEMYGSKYFPGVARLAGRHHGLDRRSDADGRESRRERHDGQEERHRVHAQVRAADEGSVGNDRRRDLQEGGRREEDVRTFSAGLIGN